MDLKDIFLHNLMLDPEYTRMSYNLKELFHIDGYAYIEIQKEMYGGRHSGI